MMIRWGISLSFHVFLHKFENVSKENTIEIIKNEKHTKNYKKCFRIFCLSTTLGMCPNLWIFFKKWSNPYTFLCISCFFRTKVLKSAPGYEDQYKTLKNRKTFLLILNPETHEFAWFLGEFIKIFPNFWTDLVRKTLFLIFEEKNKTLIASGFCQNRSFFMKKVSFFQNFKKK